MNLSTRRAAGIAVIGGFLLIAVVLLLSDRAGSAFGDVVATLRSAAWRAEQATGIDVIDRRDIPYQADDLVHVAFWAAGMVAIGWVLRHRVSLALAAVIVGTLSLVLEIAQPVFSATRGIQKSDVIANFVGVGFGTVALVIVLWGLRLASRVTDS